MKSEIERLVKDGECCFSYSRWIRYENSDLYLRRGFRYFFKAKTLTLEVANVTRDGRDSNIKFNPMIESTGFMNRLMGDVESVALDHGLAVYIENVMNEFLPRWFRRRGYVEVPILKPPCYFRLLSQ